MLQEGIGDSLGILLKQSISFVANIGIAFYFGWELSLALSVFLVAIMAFGALIGKLQAFYSHTEADLYNQAGFVAEEVFSSLKTVLAFGGQQKEIDR